MPNDAAAVGRRHPGERAGILLVEDDRALGRMLKDKLAAEGFDVEWVTDAGAALRRCRERGPDLILIDMTPSEKPALDAFHGLQQNGRTPIVVLTARGQKADKLLGLSLDADDYLTKPFDFEELLARVHAVLRRSGPRVDRLTLGAVTVDFRTRLATKGKSELHLTDREFAILEYLALRHERVVSRNELLRGVWGYAEIPATRSVDHAIVRLRKKIEPDPASPRFIRTVHGDGYRLTRPAGVH
jgi:DNA-binding response OmpR family regulator